MLGVILDAVGPSELGKIGPECLLGGRLIGCHGLLFVEGRDRTIVWALWPSTCGGPAEETDGVARDYLESQIGRNATAELDVWISSRTSARIGGLLVLVALSSHECKMMHGAHPAEHLTESPGNGNWR